MKALNNARWLAFMAGASVLSLAVYYGYTYLVRSHYLDFLIWNLFLAWLPFAVSSMIFAWNLRLDYKGGRWFTAVMGIVWLLLYPNAPYLLTDLLHLTVMKDMYTIKGHWTYHYWYAFVVIFLFSWLGLALGFISAYQLQYVVRKRAGAAASWLFIAATSVLAGYGILLGREYRLNSWDMLNDTGVFIGHIVDSLQPSTLPYSMGFGMVIAFVYITFYGLINWFAVGREEQDPAPTGR